MMPSFEKNSLRNLSRPAVPRLCLQNTLPRCLSPRASASRMRRQSGAAYRARGSVSLESSPETRVSPRFGWEPCVGQPETGEGRVKALHTRQAKAEAAHIARRRASGFCNDRCAKGSCEDAQAKVVESTVCLFDLDLIPCTAARRPNPLLRDLPSSRRDSHEQSGGEGHEPTRSLSEIDEISMGESMKSTFDSVLEEHAAYLAAFGHTDSDVEVCSFAGSDGDRVTDLCQRAQDLIREMGSTAAPLVPTLVTPSMAPTLPPPALQPRPVSPRGHEDDPSTWPSSQRCQEAEALFRELGATATPCVTPPTTAPASPRNHQQSNAPGPGCDEDPSTWPDLQPWLRGLCPSVQFEAKVSGLCPSVQFDAEASVMAQHKGGIQLSDLQFRISRLELQVGQINSADEKPKGLEEVAELKKHVEIAQAELQAARQETQESNEQLRRLLQHVGRCGQISAHPRPGGVEASHACGQVGHSVLRSSSVSSQESQGMHRVPSLQFSAGGRSPVRLPRARSSDSVARRHLYPSVSSEQVNSLPSLHGYSNCDKQALKQRAFVSPRPRVLDVPLRMCTSEQLIQVAKQKPAWLQKSPETVRAARAGNNARPQLCCRTSKSTQHA